MKVLAGIVLLASLTACGADVNRLEADCAAAGGKVIVVGTQANCVVDGTVVEKWTVSR